ncbi:hypothetical protein A2160_05375 [Candidatus Beckwithbacteria bacterium RBG_13_42_9]|uniref:Uncharacterized protein n=1 Tax=Candidatus Beckwithbacteria bacterium RBG_13_42_9 TaxID=1797457 RepID=A0A1F5E6P0_9BACT|nr:MAG: hypothetical protein A2160_05375 [Candidatus Beckwithbacteria bacterium RBG_13_42_9]
MSQEVRDAIWRQFRQYYDRCKFDALGEKECVKSFDPQNHDSKTVIIGSSSPRCIYLRQLEADLGLKFTQLGAKPRDELLDSALRKASLVDPSLKANLSLSDLIGAIKTAEEPRKQWALRESGEVNCGELMHWKAVMTIIPLLVLAYLDQEYRERILKLGEITGLAKDFNLLDFRGQPFEKAGFRKHQTPPLDQIIALYRPELEDPSLTDDPKLKPIFTANATTLIRCSLKSILPSLEELKSLLVYPNIPVPWLDSRTVYSFMALLPKPEILDGRSVGDLGILAAFSCYTDLPFQGNPLYQIPGGGIDLSQPPFRDKFNIFGNLTEQGWQFVFPSYKRLGEIMQAGKHRKKWFNYGMVVDVLERAGVKHEMVGTSSTSVQRLFETKQR